MPRRSLRSIPFNCKELKFLTKAGVINKNIGLYNQILNLEHQFHLKTGSLHALNLAASGNGSYMLLG